MGRGLHASARRELWLLFTQCAWCNGLKFGPWYVPFSRKIVQQWALQLPLGLAVVVSSTHGVCPDCAERVCRRARSERSERVKALLEDLIL